MKRVAVTGAEGNLGKELVRIGCVPLSMDITDPDQIREELKEVEPDVIINCAAKSLVDGCETPEGEKSAIAVNTRGVHNLRAMYDGQIIHISTSYVFNGKRGPYKETARPLPLQGYGYSKWAGEVIFQAYDCRDDVIVRTVGLYGGHKPDFASFVLTALANGEEVDVFKGLKFNPTYIPHLAEALMQLVNVYKPPKIVNIVGKENLSRYDFARKIASKFGYDRKRIIPISKERESSLFDAPRPKNAGLRTNLAKKMKLPIYSVMEGLEDLRYQWESKQA